MPTRPGPRPALLLVAGVVLWLLAGPAVGLATADPSSSASSSPSGSASTAPSPSSTRTPEQPRPDPRQGLAGVSGLTPALGASYGSTAPVLRTGRYIDTTPAVDDYRFYKLDRTSPGSTFSFGLTMLGPDVVPGKRPSLRLYAKVPDTPADKPEVRVCGVARASGTDKATIMPVSSIAAWSDTKQPLCATSPELILGVSNGVFRSGADHATPQTRVGAPYELDVWEQPRITNLADLKQVFSDDWVYLQPGTPSVQAEAGLAPSSATVLPAGKTAAVDLPLGRVGWFAVPVEVGERLQLLVSAADGSVLSGAGFETRIYSPVGGSVDDTDAYNLPAPSTGNLAAGPNLLAATTGEVYQGNRVGNGDSGYGQHSGLSAVGGYDLVAVYVQRLDGATVTSLPITLTTRLDEHHGYHGDRYVDATYASPLTPFPAPEGTTPTAYAAPTVSRSTARSTARSTGDWAVIGGLGVAALAFAGVGGALLRRRA